MRTLCPDVPDTARVIRRAFYCFASVRCHIVSISLPQVDLQVVAEASLQSELVTPAANAMTATVTYGVALAEAEVDALTGV